MPVSPWNPKWRPKMDPYFEIYIPRLTRTLKLSKLRALTKLHNPKRHNEFPEVKA